MRREDLRNQTQQHSRKKHFFWFLIVLLIIGLVIYGGKKYHDLKGAIDNSYKSANIQKVRDADKQIKENKPISILLLGTDTGELDRSYKGRTDSLMVITLNPKTKSTTMTSIPRDTAVNIPGHPEVSPSKINAAYTYGSAGTSMKTVEQLLNVPIDYYALVNMGGMENIINKVGGVDITPSMSFTYEGNNFVKGNTEHMDGKKALAYSRMRYQDPQGDYGRQSRQRQVLSSLLARKAAFGYLLNQSFVDSVSKQVQTDLTMGDITILASKYHDTTKNVKQTHLQGHGEEIDGSDMEVVSQSELQAASDFIRKNLGLPRAPTGSINYSSNTTETNNNQEVNPNN